MKLMVRQYDLNSRVYVIYVTFGNTSLSTPTKNALCSTQSHDFACNM